MKPIKMIAIDLDGTLLNSEKKVSTKDQKMIESPQIRSLHCSGNRATL